MKIAVNTVFNQKYLHKYIDTNLQPHSGLFDSKSFMIYEDMNGTIVEDVFPVVLFVPEPFLDVIDKLNSKHYDNSMGLGAYSLDLLINTLLSTNETARNNVLNFLQSIKVITANENTSIRSITSNITGFTPNMFNKKYDEAEDMYVFTYDLPLELVKPYQAENNIGLEKLYLVFPSLININYGKTSSVFSSNGKYSPLHMFFNPGINGSTEQCSYLAFQMGEPNSSADIIYDQLNKIEYIDKLRLHVKLPKSIS
jgi:hypothetical protein